MFGDAFTFRYAPNTFHYFAMHEQHGNKHVHLQGAGFAKITWAGQDMPQVSHSHDFDESSGIMTITATHDTSKAHGRAMNGVFWFGRSMENTRRDFRFIDATSFLPFIQGALQIPPGAPRVPLERNRLNAENPGHDDVLFAPDFLANYPTQTIENGPYVTYVTQLHMAM